MLKERRAMNTIRPAGSPASAFPLSPGVRAGDFIFVSGQVATNPDGSPFIGNIRDEITGAIDAVEAVLQAAGASLDHVVKVQAFLSNAALFSVFNEIYAQRFTADFPARTTVVVGFGHPDVRVEIEAIGYVGS
jgi:2-iminobutanoate/2-iminopropanoate deaminase